jgi:hypothetical protein
MKRIKMNRTKKIALMISIALSLMFAVSSFGTAKAWVGPAGPVGPGYPVEMGYAGFDGIGCAGYGYEFDDWGFCRGNSGPVPVAVLGPGGTPTYVPYCPFHERWNGWRCEGGDKDKYDFWGNRRD